MHFPKLNFYVSLRLSVVVQHLEARIAGSRGGKGQQNAGDQALCATGVLEV